MAKRRLWAMEDRPREKLASSGAVALSDAELLAVLLGTGTATHHVLDLAQKMLDAAENDIGRLTALSIKDLMSTHGVGYAKAVRLKAVMEFSRRAQFESAPKNFRVTTSHDAFRVLVPNLGDLPHEEFWMILLNRASKVISKRMISRGGLSSTVVDSRPVFRIALQEVATAIIVAHNHPSGNLNPSQADIDLTKRLVAAGQILDIQLVDHLIISGNKYCSFADSGLL